VMNKGEKTKHETNSLRKAQIDKNGMDQTRPEQSRGKPQLHKTSGHQKSDY
jgi:hypothetical protein